VICIIGWIGLLIKMLYHCNDAGPETTTRPSRPKGNPEPRTRGRNECVTPTRVPGTLVVYEYYNELREERMRYATLGAIRCFLNSL
jgi:hypothetical protein